MIIKADNYLEFILADYDTVNCWIENKTTFKCFSLPIIQNYCTLNDIQKNCITR